MKDLMPHWLTKRAYLSPNKQAIETESGDYLTFLQLKESSEKYARQLAHLGVEKNDKVALFSVNEVNMVVAIHALSYLGAVAVLLNARLTQSEISYQLEDAEIKLIICSDKLKDQIDGMQFKVPHKSYSQISSLKEAAVQLVEEINLEDPFTIVYTSGTTGNPKGVVHSYGNHWWSAIGSALNLGLSEKDKWLAVLPLFHVGGFSICMRSVIYGMTTYLLEEFDEQLVNEAILHGGVTIASVVTVMLQRLKEDLKDQQYPKEFRCMLLGGGPAPKSLLDDMADKEIPVYQSYGLTETSSQIATLGHEDALKKLGSSGKALFPGQLIIHQANEEGIGEIFVKGPMVTKGYYGNEKANQNSFQNGYLATGDLGYLDEEGFLYVVDRRKDLIISGGENIYPTEIESILSGHEDIREIAVLGMEDDYWGEVPVAFVVKRDPKLTEREVIHFAKKYLANYKVPKRVFFQRELPRTASNKLMKNSLRKLLNEKPPK